MTVVNPEQDYSIAVAEQWLSQYPTWMEDPLYDRFFPKLDWTESDWAHPSPTLSDLVAHFD